jgi:hypothetical protein
MIIDNGSQSIKFSPRINEYPKELFGSWFCFTKIEDHPIVTGMCSVYFNDEYPSGTIIVSNYILDQYPDIYATWNKDYMSHKMFVSPKLRKSGKGKNALIVGDQFIKFLGNELKYIYGEHENGDFLFNGAYSLNKNINNKDVNDSSMFDFRDPAYPIIHFDKRFIKYEI